MQGPSMEINVSYDEQLQKLEAESRMHIQVKLIYNQQLEQQMKLEIDAMEESIQNNEKIIAKLNAEINVCFIAKKQELKTELEKKVKECSEIEKLKKTIIEKDKILAEFEKKNSCAEKKYATNTSRTIYHAKVIYLTNYQTKTINQYQESDKGETNKLSNQYRKDLTRVNSNNIFTQIICRNNQSSIVTLYLRNKRVASSSIQN